ncbi:MAG: hypothetical protein WAR79_13265 [Melioribacteraceae bacterium]
MDDKKIVINSTSDNFKIGNDVIKLVDESFLSFTTNSLLDFIEYVVTNHVDNSVVYFDLVSAKLFLKDSVRYNSDYKAICKFIEHPVFTLLKRKNGNDLSLDELINLLTSLKSYSSGKTILLLDKLNDLSIKKVISIERSKDNSGNFSYSFKSSNQGKSDYSFPENLTFSFPLLKYLKQTSDFNFDFSFNYSIDSEGTFGFKFRLNSFTFEDDFINCLKTYIEEILVSSKIDCYFGSASIVKATDEWKYKINSVE